MCGNQLSYTLFRPYSRMSTIRLQCLLILLNSPTWMNASRLYRSRLQRSRERSYTTAIAHTYSMRVKWRSRDSMVDAKIRVITPLSSFFPFFLSFEKSLNRESRTHFFGSALSPKESERKDFATDGTEKNTWKEERNRKRRTVNGVQRGEGEEDRRARFAGVARKSEWWLIQSIL